VKAALKMRKGPQAGPGQACLPNNLLLLLTKATDVNNDGKVQEKPDIWIL